VKWADTHGLLEYRSQLELDGGAPYFEDTLSWTGKFTRFPEPFEWSRHDLAAGTYTLIQVTVHRPGFKGQKATVMVLVKRWEFPPSSH
jgi:hypothetical protein